MPDSGQRKTIDEIIVKYELEPSLGKEIYVEGSTDKALIEYFFLKANMKNITVLEINTVTVEKSAVLSMGLDDNNRSRLICLSSLVDKGIICIIDSDFDFLEKPAYQKVAHLISTDYTSMELYCFNEETLERILISYPGKQHENYQSFLEILGVILIDLFLIRFAKEKIDKLLPKIDFTKELTVSSNDIFFKRNEYLEKYLKYNPKLIAQFNTFIESKSPHLPTDLRKKIQGHDFVSLLQKYLEINQKDAKETFRKSLYSSLEFSKLNQEDMFKNLLEQLKS